MINEKNRNKISYIYLDSVIKYNEKEKQIRYFGTDTPIYNSEIHVISAIARNLGIHIAGLAEILKITKGSVSEIVKKLEKKGLVEKRIDSSNASRLSLYLTEKGEKAHKNHMKFHKEFNDYIENILLNYSDTEKEAIRDFLKLLDEKINDI